MGKHAPTIANQRSLVGPTQVEAKDETVAKRGSVGRTALARDWDDGADKAIDPGGPESLGIETGDQGLVEADQEGSSAQPDLQLVRRPVASVLRCATFLNCVRFVASATRRHGGNVQHEKNPASSISSDDPVFLLWNGADDTEPRLG